MSIGLPDFDIDLHLRGGRRAARAISKLGYGGRLWLSPRKWMYAKTKEAVLPVDIEGLRQEHAPITQKAGGALCAKCNVWMPCPVTELIEAYERCKQQEGAA